MRIVDFINSDFKAYVNYDNERNIPHIMDGLKISQRKILYAFLEEIGYGKVVVERAAGRAATKTHYQHGATNMEDVMVHMAQTFPGSNNMNLLNPLGQFGTQMDKESSATRYISTQLNDNFKKLFDADDTAILVKQYSEGDEIEPETYVPKLPLLLINGSKGTGNGFASNILSYKPEDVKEAVQDYLKHGTIKKNLVPWMRGYKGTITKDAATGQVTYMGCLERRNSNTLVITELPPSMNLVKMKGILNKLVDQKFIKGYDNESTEKDGWKIVLDCPRSTAVDTDVSILFNKFKLIERETETLCVWRPGARIKIYKTVEQLLIDWVNFRLEYYEKRRLHLIKKYEDELSWLETKLVFIQFWNENATRLVKYDTDELYIQIEEHVTDVPELVERLLALRISSLSLDQVSALEKAIAAKKDELVATKATTGKTMMTKEVKEIKL